MLDRDKVIKDLKEYRDRDYIREGTNYFDNDPRYRRMIIDNALALLKEQEEQIKNRDESLEKAREEIKWLRGMLKEHEEVEPILIREGRNKNYNDYVCPRCDNVVVYEQNYCSECGVRFLWEGR